MRIAVAEEIEYRPAAVRRWMRVAHQPDLAGATLHLVRLVSRRIRQRRELAAELDKIAIPVIPAVEHFKVAQNLVDRHVGPISSPSSKYIGTKPPLKQWPRSAG